MIVNKGYKYRIYPNEEQRIFFAKTFGCVRFIYNRILSDKIDHYKKTKETLRCTPAPYKKEFPWLKEVDSLALANTNLDLGKAYNAFFAKKANFPRFKSKKHYNKYTTHNQKGTVAVVSNYIRLPKVGYIEANFHRPLPEGCVIKSATVSMTASGRYYCSLGVELEVDEPEKVKPSFETTLGLDYSSGSFYVDSEGNVANYSKYYRKSQKRLAKEQRRLSRKVKGSKNRNKQRQKIARVHEKVQNQRMDFCHKESRKIANSYDAVCVEDINLRAMAACLNLGKSTNDNGFGMFRTFLKYKLQDQGKHYVVVNKWYASSKTCSHCGFIYTGLKLSERSWTCKDCGITHDRDFNAATNIKREGFRLLQEMARS
jgi:putative transposase